MASKRAAQQLLSDGTVVVNGDELIPIPGDTCIVCRKPCYHASISFEAPIHPILCIDRMWHGYWEALCKK